MVPHTVWGFLTGEGVQKIPADPDHLQWFFKVPSYPLHHEVSKTVVFVRCVFFHQHPRLPRNWYIYVHDWLIFFWQIYTVRPNAWIPIKLVFQTALEATEAEETLSGSQVKYNIYIIRLYSSLGTQNHAKWRFYTLNIWVIDPKNEGLGFPWLVPQNLTWIPDTRQIAI